MIGYRGDPGIDGRPGHPVRKSLISLMFVRECLALFLRYAGSGW